MKKQKATQPASEGQPKPDGDERGALRTGAFPIVGVGASAGGLEAFTELLKALPLDTGMGFVLVQHLDPVHESQLTQILARATSLPVREIKNNQPVKANHIYVIPRDASLSIAGGVLKLEPRQKARAPLRIIDAFFESLAQDLRELAVGVVLSGTASDGTLGLEAIKAEGGITFAQDRSAKHDSMPKSAEAAGCVDLVLSPAEIAKELARIAKHPYVAGRALAVSKGTEAEDDRAEATAHQDDASPLPSGGKGTPSSGGRQARDEAEHEDAEPSAVSNEQTQNGYKKILLLLRNHSGVDFSLYKSTTIQRRIARRLLLSRQDTLQTYADFLRGNTKELDALYSDVLISVTSFFRNPETFEALQEKVLPELLKKPGDDPLRCWVLGCSTGQEAYSLAMAFSEAAEHAPRMRKLQIFATDLNDTLLDKARHGLYAKSLADDVTPQRLQRFFVEEEGGYRINKALREMVVFARQNLIADPPFSRMDLISCRNLLIYLEPSLQRQAMPTFHYALKPGGFLLLGASESIGTFTGLFEPVDRKLKIFTKKSAPLPALHLPLRKAHSELPPGPRLPVQPDRPEPPEAMRGELDAQREADRISVTQFAPPSVLVNADLAVLQFRGPTGAFLEPPVGKASFDVLKMAREGLMLPLRSAIHQAKKDNKTARKENVRVKRNGSTRTVNLEVIPLKNLRERCFLILFEEADKPNAERAPVPAPKRARKGRSTVADDPGRSSELETELAEMREYLQSLQEQHDASNEEVQSANEEVQSANEELQSVNEELETSKEELESANEELTTVNDEMQNRNVELNRLNNDLLNLQTSIKLTILLLGRDLSIRRFSPQAEKQFELLLADMGRPISLIRHGLLLGDEARSPLDLEALASGVIAEVREQEREVRDKQGRWHLLRVRPYLTLDGKVDGAVLALTDIDALKRSELAAAELAAIVRSSDDAIISKDLRGVIRSWNTGAERLFGYTETEVIGKSVALLIPTDRADEEPGILARIGRGESVDHYETVRQRKDGSLVDVSLTVSPVRDAGGQIIGGAKIARDITERKRVERAQREGLEQRSVELSEGSERKNEFLAMLGHELRNPLSALSLGFDLLGKLPDDNKRRQELRAMMARQTTRIGALLDQLLDVARVTSGKVELKQQRIDLADVVAAALEALRPILETQKHKIDVSLPPEKSALVMGDAIRLTQVVENLLTNAAKYTNEGGQLALLLTADAAEVKLVVRDNGSGMSADLLPHVFEVFTQAPRTLDRAKGGLGLGLPIVQRLVQMHGGQVSAASPGLGRGSEFVVTLPRLQEGQADERMERKPAVDAPAKAQSQRILVVDDEKDSADTLVELLEDDGHQALAVHDGPAALEAARAFAPEVVLLDLGLPEMDGYEVARRLRDEHRNKKMLLIAVTGYQSDAARLKEAGFDQHLIKPPNLQKLFALLLARAGGNGSG